MKTLLFLTGLSGSGKGYFKENILPKGLFYNLISMTTRNIRDGETDGTGYYFKTEQDFANPKDFVTYLDVNKLVRKPGDLKWLYGVSVDEFMAHKDENLIYDVIEPKYIKQMIDWCRKNKLDFDFKILYFLQPKQGFDIAKARAGMKKDMVVRKQNTSSLDDFKSANLGIDWVAISNESEMIYDKNMIDYINLISEKEGKDSFYISPSMQII